MQKSLILFLAVAIVSSSFIACGGSKKDDRVRPRGPNQTAATDGREPQGNDAEEMLQPSVTLRSESQNMTEEEAEEMVRRLGFYTNIAKLKPFGKFVHQYAEKYFDGDKIIVDFVTGLMWHPSGSGRDITYVEIEWWLADLNAHAYAGFSDWRLPTLEEAASLIEGSEKNGNLQIDPLFSKKQSTIWTGDFLNYPNLKELDNEGNEIGPYPPAQWVVGFSNAGMNPTNRNSNFGLRPVRSLENDAQHPSFRKRKRPGGTSAKAEPYYKKGLARLEKDMNEALDHFNQALVHDPRHYMALYLKAVISREFADWGTADAAIAKVKKIVSEISEEERIEIVQDKWGPYKTGLRVIAVQLLESPDILKETLYNDGDKDIRAAAVNNPNFSDPNELVRVALDAERFKYDSTARHAVRKIENQALLQYVFRHATDHGIQREALLRITDAQALAQIAADHEDPQFRKIAAERLSLIPE